MSVLEFQVRPGAYFDSIVLMQLQAGLAKIEGVEDAGAVMATEVNLAVLDGNGLLPADLGPVKAEDLVIAVRAHSEAAATAALSRIDQLLARKGGGETDDEYRPRSLEQADRLLPEASWVLISVPGRFASGLARQALDLGKNVFLYSDNVPIEAEVELKEKAVSRGLLVMGPDC
ncbi:MAG: protein FdrA, partial [Acidobacteria bacterium]|nr:protein FdrA [Acidobacteriota bacterium]